MTRCLTVLTAGPAVTVQDLGRMGFVAQGVSRGGAMDRSALHEGAALLQQPLGAALEMIGFGGSFRASEDLRFALTGAPMRATLDGAPVAWHACHLLPAGKTLEIGGALQGAIGYLHLGGGIDAPEQLGSASTHVTAGLGAPLKAGDVLKVRPDAGAVTGIYLAPEERFSGGVIHVLCTHQSHLFGAKALDRFCATTFTRDARANRQGIRFAPTGRGFATEGGLSVVSEIITPGDIQITGDGAPYVLMSESQTTGGYPRIATVVPSDLPRVAQAPLGAEITFCLLNIDEAADYETRRRAEQGKLAQRCYPLFRDPADMRDLLEYNLVSGVIDARDT